MKSMVWKSSIGALLGLFLALPAGAQSSVLGETNVTFLSKDGTSLKGFLAVPKGKGPFPAVVMVHEWWGLTPDIVRMANRLADEGFIVLAADCFRGKVATTPQEAQAQVTETPATQIAQDLDAAYAFLAKRSDVDGARTGSLGFCFGGRQSLFLGTRQANLKATVILYGSGLLSKPEDVGVLGKSGPVLGIFGEKDSSIPPEQRAFFSKILTNNKITYTEKVYPGVGHAFVKDGTVDTAGPAQDAWQQVVKFLKANLVQS